MRIFGAAVLIGLFVGGIGCQVIVWNECRSAGHSFVYCAKMIAR